MSKKNYLRVLLLFKRSESSGIIREAQGEWSKGYCLFKCHPGFAAFLHVRKHDSRCQLGFPLLLLGPCRPQLRLSCCVRTHLTGPLLTRGGASQPRERAGLGARLQGQVQQFKNVRINWVDRESLQSKPEMRQHGPISMPHFKRRLRS